MTDTVGAEYRDEGESIQTDIACTNSTTRMH